VTGIAFDLRAVQPGDLFAALPGARFRGRRFASEAVARGAAALLVPAPLELGVPELLVADTRAALARVAASFYGAPSHELGVIGVTGTDGKTTTTHLIDAILRAAGLATGCISSVSVRAGEELGPNPTRLTTPESPDVQRLLRDMADASASWAILEASSHGLALNRLDETRFRIAAVTNITADHLDFHRTHAAYRRAKALLFERTAAAGGTAVVNADDPGAIEMLAQTQASPVIRYSACGQPADVWASAIELDQWGSTFELATESGRERVKLSLPGRFNIANALCAAGVAMAAGVPLEVIARALESAPAVPGRMAEIDAGQPFAVIVDYAHTPPALAHVLEHLRACHPRGRIIVVYGASGQRFMKLSGLGEAAAQRADYSVFTTNNPGSDDPLLLLSRLTAGAVKAGAHPEEDFTCIADRRQAIQHALAMAQANDCVLLAGKGHEPRIIWGDDERAWDEAEVARQLLAALGYEPAVGAQCRQDPASRPTVSKPAAAMPSLSIERIFGGARSPLPDNLDPSTLRTVLVTGDIMPSRQVDAWIRRQGPDHPFTRIAALLHQADVVIGNLEAPLVARCRPVSQGLTFCGIPAFAEGMARAGIDVVALENNHIENFGRSGIDETKRHLEAAGVDYATVDHMAVRDVRGLKIGVVAFSGVGHRFDRRQIAQRMERSRAIVDLLLAVFHWGKEYVSIPEPCAETAPDDPRAIARLAIDHGADLVIGNHPHWVQGIELYRGKLIAYSHGNLVFDQLWSIETRQGVIGRYSFCDTALVDVEYLPIVIDEKIQPCLVDDEEGAPIIRRMEGSSIILELDA
jgi:UDP-N-acetylmuramoyl-L-alanyl-D-glutamate--2,6-diaminopimelate ligase